jgi:WD40 repeat protein
VQPDDQRDPLELLSEEFLQRHRRGEDVRLESFADDHPEHAEDIRAIFPTLLRLERSREPEPARSEEQIGRWRILDELGRGGMGVVYLAEDDATRKRVALKLMTAPNAGTAARFRREARAVARVDHPDICHVVDVGAEGDRLWIAFEYLEGETVAEVLKRERRDLDPASMEVRSWAPARWFEVAEGVARALHATHEAGLVHRDIKPANLMLTGSGRAVVLDFGLACEDPTGERTRLTHTGVPVGTPAYMSPEQIHARPDALDGRTDVYALGATLYEAVTLRPPFEGPTVASLFSRILTRDPEPARRLNAALTRDQALVLGTALEKSPERRYRTALAFADDLRRARTGQRVRARAAGPLRNMVAWAGRNPATASIAVAITLALATGLAVALSLLSVVREAHDDEATAARTARARALASASAAALRSDASLSLLLARAALRARRSPRTISQLHAAVHGSLERTRLTGHGGPVHSLDWSADSQVVATGCSDGRARLFRADGAHLCTVPPASEDVLAGPCDVSLSPSGKLLATVRADRTARLWSASGALLARLDDGIGAVHEVRFLGEETIATVGIQGRIALHGPRGDLRRRWHVGPGGSAKRREIYSVAVSMTPWRLHILTRAGIAVSYDDQGTETGRRLQAEGRPARLFDGGRLAFSWTPSGGAEGSKPSIRVLGEDTGNSDTMPLEPDGMAKFCGADTWWCVWTPDEGATILDHSGGRAQQFNLNLLRDESPYILCASPEGDRLCTVRASHAMRQRDNSATDPIRLWTPRARSLWHVSSTETLASAARLSPLGRRLAVGWHTGGLVTLHESAPQELATGVPRWRESDAFRYPPMVTADGRRMVYLDGRKVRVLGDDGVEVSRYELDRPILSVAMEPALGLVLSTDSEGVARIHDLNGTLVRSLPVTPAILGGVWLGHDGEFATIASGRTRFHDAHGAVVASFEGIGLGPPPQSAYANEVAIASEDGVGVFAPNGTLLWKYSPRGDERPMCYCGSASGRSLLALGTGEVEVVCRCHDAHGREQWSATVVPLARLHLCISPDGSRVVLPDRGGLQIRDGAGVEIQRVRLSGSLSSVAFDAAGSRIVASTGRGLLRVWDRNGVWLFDLPPHAGGSTTCFSADGRRLATVSDSMARLFTTDPDELEELAKRRTTREFTEAERANYADMLEPER